MEMLKDFNILSFAKMKPPGDNTFDTMQEIKLINKIPFNKKLVKSYDDIPSAFEKTAREQGIENYDKSIAEKLIKESVKPLLRLKFHFNRPRPKVIAKAMNIRMNDLELKSMATPSYPSGHSAQGILIARVLGDKYPSAKAAFLKTAERISYSRNIAKAHYMSDSKLGTLIGEQMYKHIKNKSNE
tara:strand:+ start:342 stop:896 length:555 start_codon:yes stop_codon:yes gene_type:complete